MKLRTTAKRTLRAESLEARQMLHGGGMSDGGEPATTEERATEIVGRFDVNEDMELSQDEVSERLWNRISEADADESATISASELTAHLDAAAADGAENGSDESGDRNRVRDRASRGERRDRTNNQRGERVSVEDRVDMFFAENDTNMDGLVTDVDDVSEELLARVADADIDGNGLSAGELLARYEARLQERFDASFNSLDANEDGGITADEVSERRWERISAADGDEGDGVVTADELQNYLDAQRAEREAEREAAAETTEDVEVEETAPVEAQVQRRSRGRSVRQR